MKKLILLAFSLFYVLTSFSQPPDLVPYLKGSLWGYADRGKKIVIEPKFTSVTLFTEKITPVSPDTLSSIFIDATGKQVGESFQGAGEFSEGFCQVQKNNLQGYIDADMNVAIPLKFKGTRPFKEGFAVVLEDSLWGVIDKTGTYVIKPKFADAAETFQNGFLYIQKKERQFFVDSKGKELKLPDNAKLLSGFDEGLAVVELTFKKNDPQFSKVTKSTLLDSVKTHAFIDNKGKIALGPFESKYKVVGVFKSGYCILDDGTGYFNYVSKEGKFSSPYFGARPFSEGYALATKAGLFGSTLYLLDASFIETYLSFTLSDAGTFSDGLMWVKELYTTRYGFINTKGEKVIDFKYDQVGDFKNGIAIVEQGGERFCIDKKGTEFRENAGNYNYYDDDDDY